METFSIFRSVSPCRKTFRKRKLTWGNLFSRRPSPLPFDDSTYILVLIPLPHTTDRYNYTNLMSTLTGDHFFSSMQTKHHNKSTNNIQYLLPHDWGSPPARYCSYWWTSKLIRGVSEVVSPLHGATTPQWRLGIRMRSAYNIIVIIPRLSDSKYRAVLGF